MKILVTFALENEFALWRKRRNFRRVAARGHGVLYEASIGATDVRVVLTGVGPVAARRSLEGVFDDSPEICIVSGLAGGLDPLDAPGAVLAARAVRDAGGTEFIESDRQLVTRAGECGAKVVDGFLTSDRVVLAAEQKKSLGALGDAVDMESLYVLQAAAGHGVRTVAIRAISDGAESNLPLDFNRTFNAQGRLSMPRILGQILRRPHQIGGVIRLARDSGHAAVALASFLDSYVPRVAVGSFPERTRAEALAV